MLTNEKTTLPKLILFDKDGTLMDFDAFWVTVTRHALRYILQSIGTDTSHLEPILSAVGVTDGVTDIRGVLCWGTYGQLGETIYEVLRTRGADCDRDEVIRLTAEAYHVCACRGIIRPVCGNIGAVLAALRERGARLAVVTTDDPVMTEKCLDAMGIRTCFDVVCTDDGRSPAKPDPYWIRRLCADMDISPADTVMVGDTLTDVRFAKNGGIRVIGVAKSETNRAILEKEADAVVPDISHLTELFV